MSAAQGPRDPVQLAVATYNVHRCIGGDGRYDPERTLNVIRELDVDVIALQELEWRPEAALHVLDELAHHTGYTPVAGPTLFRGDGHYGNALLTRLAVRRIDRLDLSVPGREARGAIDIELETARGVVRVLATHLGLRAGERRMQTRRLLARIEERPTPTVLMGDLNEWLLRGRPLRRLRAHFGRAPAPATFPARWPVLALDRIWVEPARMLREVRAHRSALARAASDHLPLRAVIDWNSREPVARAE